VWGGGLGKEDKKGKRGLTNQLRLVNQGHAASLGAAQQLRGCNALILEGGNVARIQGSRHGGAGYGALSALLDGHGARALCASLVQNGVNNELSRAAECAE